MLLPILSRGDRDSRAGVTVNTVTRPEERDDGRPESATHDRIDLWQTFALKLPHDRAPMSFRLRQSPRDLRLAWEQTLALDATVMPRTWRSRGLVCVLDNLRMLAGRSGAHRASASTTTPSIYPCAAPHIVEGWAAAGAQKAVIQIPFANCRIHAG
jgi:hypothetical protein